MERECKKVNQTVTSADTSHGALRPRFRERQVLRAADLGAQQVYLISSRRRHNIGQHGWGIVQGLELVATRKAVLLQPGLAVDGYGRELIVTEVLKLPTSAFTQLKDDVLDVWLLYNLTEASVPLRGSWNCGPGKNSRAREEPVLRFTRATQTEPRLPPNVPRKPMEVPSADLPFPPHRTSPDDPSREWPIYLGTIKQTKIEETPLSVDPKSPRPYASLTGELVSAPSGRARMQIGAELQTDTRRYAVATAGASGKVIERVGIDREGNTFINGKTTITDHLTTRPTVSQLRLRENKAPATSEPVSKEPLCTQPATTGAREKPGTARMLNFRQLAATPAVAAPWQIYRTSIQQANRTVQQLRFEIGHPGDKGEPKLFEFTVGKLNDNGFFVPCFSLGADCSLTINGEVTVGGQLVESAIKPDIADPRFKALLAAQWIEGTKIGEVAATTGTIQGEVSETNGPVIPGANVELVHQDISFTLSVPTGTDGRFVASAIPAGRYNVTVSAAGFTSQTIAQQLEVSQILELTVKLKRTGTIQGEVSETNGPAIRGANVELVHQDISFTLNVPTGTDGRFIAPALTAGRYSVTVSAAGFTSETIAQQLEVGQILELTVELNRIPTTGTILGTVMDLNGAVIAGATVQLTNIDTSVVRSSTTNDEGRFNVSALPAGRYSIRAVAPGFEAKVIENPLIGGQTLSITLILETPSSPG
jgi:Carboxypeptidase regulatory-like domain